MKNLIGKIKIINMDFTMGNIQWKYGPIFLSFVNIQRYNTQGYYSADVLVS